MEKQIKKSAVDLTDLALGIIVLGIVVTIGALVLTGVRNARLTDLDVVTTHNETILASDGGTSLANKWVQGIVRITNESETDVAPDANYSLVISEGDGLGTVSWVGSDAVYNGTDVNATYTWYNTSSKSDWGLADDAATGLAEYGNWFKIIVIVGIAAVVLSLIFMAFGRRGGEAGGSY